MKKLFSYKKIGFLFPSFIWLGCVLAGLGVLVVYSNTPGEQSVPQTHWPVQSKLKRKPGVPTFVVFAHPHCPCSQATIGELERLAVDLYEKAQVHVLFYKPQNRTENWVKEGLWKTAISIPGAVVGIDSNGNEADLFGAKTSGQVYFYNPEGRLVFSGGITPARGHRGDSAGRASILSWFENKNRSPASANAPVFGCALRKTSK